MFVSLLYYTARKFIIDWKEQTWPSEYSTKKQSDQKNDDVVIGGCEFL